MSSPRLDRPLLQARAALRAGRIASAERILAQFIAAFPGDLACRWLMGVARLERGDAPGASALLNSVLLEAPEFPDARIDLARADASTGQLLKARQEIRRVVERDSHHNRAWLAYGDILVELERYPDARVAFERAQKTDPERALIERATASMLAANRREPEEIFRAILRKDASHVAALCGLAAVSLEADRPYDAERLLRHALKQCAHLPLAWRGLGPTLLALGRLLEAEAAAHHLLELEPENPQSSILLGGVATRLMRQDDALTAYERAVRLKPGEVRLWMSIGHVQKTLGHRSESEMAYKTALELEPGYAEAYWSLADLKNYRFSDTEVADMNALADRPPPTPNANSDLAQLHFALGKALEQRQDYGRAFTHYSRGNLLRRRDAPFDIEHFEQRTKRIRAAFGASFFATRDGVGEQSRAPIFIVGLPRSGSTLIEQILASHSQIEGTMELPNILNYVREFDDATPGRNGYPEAACQASASHLSAIGRRYLDETAPLRGRMPFFTDKLPNNFSHVGLIHAILPNATIIDARRHPLDCCFSNFKQYFAEGQTFSYSLEDLARYYRCYLSLMEHWNTVLPGKVLRVHYEELVNAPETNIRRLLAHCGVPFEDACLQFHQTRRSVRTASAEQVRQPIYTSSVGHWRHFEHDLEPLRLALGDVIERYQNND